MTKKSPIVFILIVVIITLALGTWFLWTNLRYERAKNQYLETITSKTGEVTTPPETPQETELPVVVYTPNGLFAKDEITELKKKVVNPFTDWNKDNQIEPVSINIEKPTPPIAGYAYKITYINKGGSEGGFLFGTTSPLEWWLPGCMDPAGCHFTDAFKAKYPEIVKLSKP